MAERELLILAFVLLAAADFWFGSVQRTALLIARASDQPAGSPAMNLLLPRFMVAAPLVVAAKWTILLVYGFRHSWIEAIALFIAGFLIDAAAPEPTSLALQFIRNRVASIDAPGDRAGFLRGMLETWEREGRPELQPEVRERMEAKNLRVTSRERAVKSLGCLVLNLALASAAIYVGFYLLRGR